MNLYRTSGFSMLPEVVKNLLIINVLAYLARMVFLVNFEIDLNDYFGLHYWEAEKFRPYQFVTYMLCMAVLAICFLTCSPFGCLAMPLKMLGGQNDF